MRGPIKFDFKTHYHIVGDWKKPDSYIKIPPLRQRDNEFWSRLAWEFLRRNMAYQKGYFAMSQMTEAQWSMWPIKNTTGSMDAYIAFPPAVPSETCAEYVVRRPKGKAILPIRVFKLTWRLVRPKDPREDFDAGAPPDFIDSFTRTVGPSDNFKYAAGIFISMPFHMLARLDLRAPLKPQLEFIHFSALEEIGELDKTQTAKKGKARKLQNWGEMSLSYEVFPGHTLSPHREIKKPENYPLYLKLIDVLSEREKDLKTFSTSAKAVLKRARTGYGRGDNMALVADVLNLGPMRKVKAINGKTQLDAEDVPKHRDRAFAVMAGFLQLVFMRKPTIR